MQNFHKLLAWQTAQALALDLHRLTESWQARGNSGLIGQLRRAALSIPSNLAEGSGRKGDGEFARFVHIAIGSANEVESQIDFACGAGIAERKSAEELSERSREIRRMLFGLLKRLESKR